MDKTLAGLIGAVGALAVVAPTQAAPASQAHPGPAQLEHAQLSQAMQAESYADLLKPIPNAEALLRMSDAMEAEKPFQVLEIQYYRHHHHHHHHRYYRPPPRRYYHHHHHHHHHHRQGGVFLPIPFARY